MARAELSSVRSQPVNTGEHLYFQGGPTGRSRPDATTNIGTERLATHTASA